MTAHTVCGFPTWLFAYGIAKQVDDITQLADFSLLRFELIFATIMLVLLAVRFLYMRKTQSSSLPDETHPMQKLAARLVHLGMYVSLTTIAISGIFVGVIYWIEYAGLDWGRVGSNFAYAAFGSLILALIHKFSQP